MALNTEVIQQVNRIRKEEYKGHCHSKLLFRNDYFRIWVNYINYIEYCYYSRLFY